MDTLSRESSAVAPASVEPVRAPNTGDADRHLADGQLGTVARVRLGRTRQLLRAYAGRALLVDLVAISALAVVLRLIFRHSALDTDPTFALVWGRDIVHGRLPDFGYMFAPTAHPLPMIESSLAALLGRAGAVDAVLVVSYWCLGALLWGAFRLGEAVFSRPVALLAVALIGSNFITVSVALGGFLDVPFMALVVWAAVLEVRRPRRGMAVLVLLAVAGLLRPEAWLLAAVYWVYAFRGRDRRLTAELIVVAAPLAWVLMDLIVTGNPVFAFTNARQTGQSLSLDRASSADLLSTAVNQLRDAMRAPVLLGGTLGLLLAMRARRASVPTAVLVLVLLVYSVLLFLRLPVPDRMLLTPGVMLSLFCGFVVFGWREQGPGAGRRLWTIGGIAVLALLVVTTPTEISRLDQLNQRRSGLRQDLSDLRALSRSTEARSALVSCPRLWVGRPETAGYVAYYLDRPLRDIGMTDSAMTARGAYFVAANARAAAALVGSFESRGAMTIPLGARRVAGDRSWSLYTRGC